MPFQVSPGVNVSEIDLTTVVPNVSTTEGALAGIFSWGPANVRRLVDGEATLTAVFGKPTNDNYETFFTGANFLAYGNRLNVVRVIDGALNAAANTAAFTPIAIKNEDDWANTTVGANVAFYAKWPGALGNSLKISVCDSANAYEQTVSLTSFQTVNGSVTTFSLASGSGSNAATITLVANVAGVANNVANSTNLPKFFTANGVITVGNSTTGYQSVKITSLTPTGVEVSNSGNYTTTVAVTFETPVYLGANVTQTSVSSQWEYHGLVDRAPGTSSYLSTRGYTGKDELHVVIVDQGGKFTGTPGTILEVFKALSRATDAKSDAGATNYYKNVLDDSSNYVWAATDISGAASNTAANIVTSTNLSPFTSLFVSGSDGNSESNCSLVALTAGYDMFKYSSDIDISLVLGGKARGTAAETTTPSSNSVTYGTLSNYIISNIAEYRADCVAFVSPAKADAVVQTAGGDATTNMVNFRNNLSISSSYAFLDSGYKYQYDKYNDKLRWIPLNGDIAGTCVRTDYTKDPWYSPAGYQRGQIKNVVKLALNPNQGQRDVLYKADINPVVTFAGSGTILFGDKTLLGRASAFDRINVRRLFIVLEKAIANASKSALFEFNDAYTRAQFVGLIEPYLRDVKGRKGITDFKVVCDDSNNTAQVIDSNQFVGDIYIKPNRSINYIQLNFVAVRSGVEFSEIVG